MLATGDGGRPRRERLIAQVVRRAVLSPASLGLVAAAVVLATQPMTLVPAGLLLALDGLLIFFRTRSPAFVRRVADELQQDVWRQQVQRAEELQRRMDRGSAALLGNVIASQERLLALAAEGGDLLPSRTRTADLLAHCLVLAERRVQLQNFLAANRATDLGHEIERLRLQVQQSSDDVARELYQQALDQKRGELDNLRGIDQAIARIDGQLEAVDATFDALMGKIVRVRSTVAGSATLDERQIMEELARLSHRVAALDASLNETLALGDRP